jgi:hypothetical protein
LPVIFPPDNTSTASLTPTVSPTPTPTASPTQTYTPTLTETATLTPTRLLDRELNLLLAKYKDDSLLVLNRSSTPLPLEPLVLKNSVGGVSGGAWDISQLNKGECVAIWKDTGRPKRPDDVECKIVGKRLVREASKRFWTSTFTVYYEDIEVGSCSSSKDECLIQYPE